MIFPHSCNLFTADQVLNFDTGTVNFTIGKVLTGAVSHATGLVKSVSGAASGYLILSNVTGTFQNNEAITDSNTPAGSALANGVNADYVDAAGKKSYTASTTATACRFVQQPGGGGNQPYGWSGAYPTALFPAGTDLDIADEGIRKLSTTEEGLSRTYLIEKVISWNPLGAVHHITAELKAVTG